MQIEVLHIDECPNLEDARKALAEVIDELALSDVTTTFTLIASSEQAAGHRFAGSPTVLVDGLDAVPGVEPTTNLSCRIYRDGKKIAGSPAKETLREAILKRLG
jgi:hypothetical protein